MAHDVLTRWGFLRLAAGAAAAAGAACNRGSPQPKSNAAKPGGKDPPTLRIAQWTHFVPAYDTWFDQDYTQRWGKEHGIEVIVDHISSVSDLPHRAAAEVIGQRGHDLFAFLAPPSVFEDEAIDHRDVIEEVAAKLGPMTSFLERLVLNPKTKKYFGFPEYWTPFPVVYRTDLWRQAGMGGGPETWEALLRAAPSLKAAGHPIGFAFSPDVDGNWSLMDLMVAYGSSIQDEVGNVTINSPATVEAVKLGAALYRAGMTDEVFNWDAASNNRFIANGHGSMTLNPVSATRAVEKQDPELAAQLALAPVPAGPATRLGMHAVTSVYVIWRFAQNQEAAKQFLVDLALAYREAFIHSELFNVPAFPGAARDLDRLFADDPQARPSGKYGLLAQAADWTTNVGHPGTANAAIDEVFNLFLIPKMFAAVARGEMTAEEAVRRAESEIKPIFDKWRARGKI